MKQNQSGNYIRKKTTLTQKLPQKIIEKTIKIKRSTPPIANNKPEIKPSGKVYRHRCASQKIVQKENKKIEKNNGISQDKKNSQKSIDIKNYAGIYCNKKKIKSKIILIANDKTHPKKNSPIIKKEIKSKFFLSNNSQNTSKKDVSDISQKNQTKIEFKIIPPEFIQKYFPTLQITKIMHIYGSTIFNELLKNEPKYLISSKFLQRHTLSPSLRQRMVDWMIEVFSVYQSDPGTFEMSVRLLDGYLDLTKRVITDNDIHLLGLCCIYIASKIEDVIPLQMINIVEYIGHNSFSKEQILKKEIEIVNTLKFDLYIVTCRDFVHMLLNDFEINNICDLKKIKGGKEFFYKFKEFSVFLCMLTFYSEELVTYRPSLLCTGVFSLAYDLTCLKIKNCEKSVKKFLHDWIYFVFTSLKYQSFESKYIYEILYDLYSTLITEPLERKNKKSKEKKKEKNKKDDNNKKEESFNSSENDNGNEDDDFTNLYKFHFKNKEEIS